MMQSSVFSNLSYGVLSISCYCDDEEEPLSGWNPSGTKPPQQEEPREPIAPPTYTEADLYPTIPDPECLPEWPLACYWPVFVANFRLDDLAEQPRNAQIASYFAAKGLLTRMFFIRESITCQCYTKYQQQSMLLDMLVYFTCEEDAVRAIWSCHRESYYGHLLNVWPGRTPVFLDVSRSHHGPCVETVARFSECDVVVEFANAKTMRAAIRYTQFWMPKMLTQATQKQGFLERDVGQELLQMIADNPGFLDMVPPKEPCPHRATTFPSRIVLRREVWSNSTKTFHPLTAQSRSPSTVIPTVRRYSAADLLPTALDSSCEPSWSVYVENFRLNKLNVALCNDQIHNYFAAKGLLATRIFIHDHPKQPFFVWYQKKVMVLDKLVYFTSQDDADTVIQLCHRDSYYGHYLNGTAAVLLNL
ncbi:hypothetical protein quinque_014350 [Culex quinquefasciatus]